MQQSPPTQIAPRDRQIERETTFRILYVFLGHERRRIALGKDTPATCEERGCLDLLSVGSKMKGSGRWHRRKRARDDQGRSKDSLDHDRK